MISPQHRSRWLSIPVLAIAALFVGSDGASAASLSIPNSIEVLPPVSKTVSNVQQVVANEKSETTKKLRTTKKNVKEETKDPSNSVKNVGNDTPIGGLLTNGNSKKQSKTPANASGIKTSRRTSSRHAKHAIKNVAPTPDASFVQLVTAGDNISVRKSRALGSALSRRAQAAFPFALGILVVAYALMQGWVDRRNPKLAPDTDQAFEKVRFQ